jgi:hypothetical protein
MVVERGLINKLLAGKTEEITSDTIVSGKRFQ